MLKHGDRPLRSFISGTVSLALVLATPGASFCAEFAALVSPPPVAASSAVSGFGQRSRPVPGGIEDFLRALNKEPRPAVREILARTAALKDSLSGVAAASGWLEQNIAVPLRDLALDSPIPPDFSARAGKLDGLRSLLAEAGAASLAPAAGGKSGQARSHAVSLAAALSGFAVPSEVAVPAPKPVAPPTPGPLPPVTVPVPAMPFDDADAHNKLAEKADAAGPVTDERAAKLRDLDALMKKYEGLLSGDQTQAPGETESQEVRSATLDALRKMFDDLKPAKPSLPAKPSPLAGTPLEKEIQTRVEAIEKLKLAAQSQVAARDAMGAMMAAADRMRAGALRDRRSGTDMLEFRKNFARLSMVMDLSYSLNLLNSAEAALAGMQAMLDGKIAQINAQRAANNTSGTNAAANKAKADQWLAEANAQIKADKDQAGIFSTLSDKSALAATRISDFKTDVSGLVDFINARDKGKSADAPTEYRRRAALLPGIQQNLTHGAKDIEHPQNISLDYIKEQSDLVGSYLQKMADGAGQIDQAPLEFAGLLVVAVPGVPAVNVSDPSAGEIQQILADRLTFWKGQLSEHQSILDSINKYSNASVTTRIIDDFGNSVPESLTAYLVEERALRDQLASQSQDLEAKMDVLAKDLQANLPSANLPPLSGRPTSDLRTLLPTYTDQLDSIVFPNTDQGFAANMDKLALVKILPFLGDATIRRIEAEGTVTTLEKAVNTILPPARVRFNEAVAALRAVVNDIILDQAYASAGFPSSEAQTLIDRKKKLVYTTLKPMLQHMKDFLDNLIIPFQQDRIASMDPSSTGDSLAMLYKEKISFYDKVTTGLHKTLPWGLASNGAKVGDAGAARANIAEERKTYQDYQKTVLDFVDQVRRRQDPNNNETEDVYGEKAPYSLVKRAALYRQEEALRSTQINARDTQINSILKEMDTVSQGRYNLAGRYTLPTDIAADSPGSKAKLRSIADDRVLQNMAAEIKRIADAALAAAGDATIGVGGTNGNIPTGNQPPVQISDLQRLALLGLEAVKRLVPTAATASGDSVAEALARYLFAAALVSSADEWIKVRLPTFSKFLTRADAAIAAALGDLDQDVLYVNSDQSQGDLVLTRKMAIYARIRDTARDGAVLFNEKAGWSSGAVSDVTDVTGYYNSLGEVYSSGNEALDADAKAAQTFKDTLARSQEAIHKQKTEVTGWLSQLNDPHESALNRVSQNISTIQDKTKVVLEANTHYHDVEKQFSESNKLLGGTLQSLSDQQTLLQKQLEAVGDLDLLSPELAQRVQAVTAQGSSWLAAGPRGPQTLIIPKSQFANFLGQLFGAFTPDSSARDIVALREDILKNPMSLAQLLPNTKMVEMGEGANGFYLVYQTEFSTPHGLESSSQVTMGNVLKLWDNNISLNGYRFASPPNSENAPFGDQGVSIQVESLQGSNWVNYLNVTFHKFIQDIPGDLTVASQGQEARMMIFDDFALLLANGRLYFGAAGFADVAMNDAKNKPYYYGGNLKSSLKFSEIASLNAEESALFAKDPRQFMQTINLDFTKFDPTMNQDWVISAKGEQKEFRRDKVGLGLDLAKALKSTNTFTMDLYYSHVAGTDDISQSAVGATILKGFGFDIGGVPVNTTVSGTGELGEKYDTVSGKLSFQLPNQGIVLSAQGKFLGDASSYLVELRKKFGTSSEMFASYGSRYVGLNNRLTLGADTTFTLGDLWRAVASGAAQNLAGGDTLKSFNESVDLFFKRDDPNNPLLGELQKVFNADVGKKLISLEIGNLTRDLMELQKAGAILDNTKMRGMIGFVSNPVSLGTTERATGAGFQVGSQTELTLTKSQKALIENKIASIYSGGLALQVRLIDLTKQWQATLAALVEARWEMALAAFMAANSDDAPLRADALSRLAAAKADYRQAALKYNAITGRGPDETLPFDGLNPQDVDRFFSNLQKVLGSNDRLSQLFAALGQDLQVPKTGFNLMDWIPWVEKLTFYVGVQLQDMLSNQLLGAGVNLRLPIYDPASAAADRSLSLQSEAIEAEMVGEYRSTKLRAQSEIAEARAWDAQSDDRDGEGKKAASEVADAIRGYRNGLISQADLWERFRRWYWVLKENLHARAMGAMKTAWAVLDLTGVQRTSEWGPGSSRAMPKSFGEAVSAAQDNSMTLEALALRSQAAAQLMDAASHRVSKVSVDLNIGVNLTAAGIALIPAFGITALGIFPIVNVDLNPDELKALSMDRRGGEAAMYDAMGAKVASDLALQLYQSYVAYRAGRGQLDIYETQVLPELERAAAGGGAKEALALDQARAEYRDLEGRQKSTLALINYLMGRPSDMLLTLDSDPESGLAELQARFGQEDPLKSRRAVLASRVGIARSVETIVDKNLKTQNLRFEPISLIGRSLGRLINALSGDGMASPELVAMARDQTLQAERDQRAFEKGLPPLLAKVRYELDLAQRQSAALEGKTDGQSRLAALTLQGRIFSLRAVLLAYGSEGEAFGAAPSGLPSSFAKLAANLEAAFADEAVMGENAVVSGPAAQEKTIDAVGNLRYYDLRQDLAKQPIGKRFVEGWVEVRLRSAATPPEALVALAHLQEERSDQIYMAAQSEARAKAQMLLARLRLNAALYRGADIETAKTLRVRLERDYAEVAAHLRLDKEATLDGFLALLPQTESGADAAAEEYLREVSALDLALVRRTLFQDGVPAGLEGSADPLLQLRANLIAEKMSYKGFTPMGAFGVFQGQWVTGLFLEAPDPIKVLKGLENILSDALRAELESQDKLKALGLKLHSLMASVADKTGLVNSERDRLEIARRNLMGMVARRSMHMATAADVVAAEQEAAAAHADFISTLSALHMDFVYLVTELQALGYPSQAVSASSPFAVPEKPFSGERTAQQELLAYWAKRLLDAGFEKDQEAFLNGIPESLRQQLRERVDIYRRAVENNDGVRHKDFSDSEKLELLTKVDQMGRRKSVEQSLAAILAELSKADPSVNAAWGDLMGFLRKDLDSQSTTASSQVKDGADMRRALRDAYWKAVPAPAPVQASYRRLSALSDDVSLAKQAALEHYLEKKLSPEDYLLRDKALDEYVKALIAYDDEVIKAFSGADLASQPRWARALNGLFGLQESLTRRRDYLRYGRGVMSLDAAVVLSQARLEALRWDPADRDLLAPASETLAFLKAMRERWTLHPKDIESLYMVKGTQGAEWLTAKDLEKLKAQNRIVEAGARRFLLPEHWMGKTPATAAEAEKAGAREITAGADVKQDELDKAKAVSEEDRRRAEVGQALKTSEAALTKGGKLAKTLSLSELRALEKEGKVFYFEAKPDWRGRRGAVHPVAAQWRDPSELVIMVEASGPRFAFDKFPTMEALEQSAWTDFFDRVEFGVKGAEALIAEAKGKEGAARRAGWLHLKLEAYAYALDKSNAVVAVFMSDKELSQARDKAKDPKSPSHDWSFQKVADLSLGLDADGVVVSAEGLGFLVRLGEAPAVKRLSGEVFGAELDGERIVKWFSNKGVMEKESEAWWIEDMTGKVWEQTDRNISPIERLKNYIDPETKLPVSLGYPMLARRADEADSALGRNDRWAYMPSKWPDIILEIPRGIVKTPVELITGRDPNQEGYIGRVYMRQTDGGDTVNHGTLGTLLRVIDIFEILPDPVGRYMDPSQFPGRVNNASPLLPGQWEHEKNPQTVDGKKDVWFGKGSLLREVRYAAEDQDDARNRILSSFEGGVRRSFVSDVRGRAGIYPETMLDSQIGRAAVEAALKNIGGQTGADGRADIVSNPDHIAVDRVAAQVSVSLGARQQADREKVYQAYLKKLKESLPPPAPGDDDKVTRLAESLAQNEALRKSLNAAVEAAKPQPVVPAFALASRLTASFRRLP